MKVSQTSSMAQAVREQHTLKPGLFLTAEWNYNRYDTIQSVNNGSVKDAYPDYFPISSIAEPRRPQRSGVIKAFVNEDYVRSESYISLPRFRTYVSSKDDDYKYWISPVKSNGYREPDFSYKFPQVVQPTVIYKSAHTANKIVITVENNFVGIDHSRVQISTNGTSWTTVATDPYINLDGQIILWLQNDGSWTGTPNYVTTQNIRGIRFIVDAVDEPSTRVGIIEISLRLENNLSEYVESYSLDEEISDVSFLAPLGTVSSNNATVVLSNIDGRFNNTNLNSPYVGLIDKNVLFHMRSGIEVNGTIEYVTMFKMYTQTWAGQEGESVSVSLSDSSEFMKTVTPNKMLFQNKTVGQIIGTLLDSFGFTNYKYTQHSSDNNQRIPYFWTNGEDTLWEIISDLAEGTQTAVYFNSNDELQIKSRRSAFNKTRPVDWNFDAIKVGNKLPDIQEFDQGSDFEANSVDVIYTPTSISEFNNGLPKMEVMWEPENSLTLRSARMNSMMSETSMSFSIPIENAATWPYEGMVNIDSEVMRYRGKQYMYYTPSGAAAKKWIYSEEEKTIIDTEQSSVDLAYRNNFTGWIQVTERGVYGSPVLGHSDTTMPANDGRYKSTWSKWGGWILWDGYNTPQPNRENNNIWKANNSIATITTNNTWSWNHNFVLRSPGNFIISPSSKWKRGYWATRLRFKSGVGPASMGEAGLMFQAPNNNFNGYFISVYPTEAIDKGRARKHNEIMIGRRDPVTGYYGQYGNGAAMEILRDKWYDLEATLEQQSNGNHLIKVYVDGMLRYQTTLSGDRRVVPSGANNGRHGLMVGTHCAVEFEYYYAAPETPRDPVGSDTSNYFDQMRGGFASGWVQRDWYNWVFYDDNYAKDMYSVLGTDLGGVIWDDFGSYVHEVREFNVDFEDPVVHSKLYFSNETQAVCPQYISSPFGAKFTIINAHRDNAIMSGEDKVTFGADNPVDQKIFVYGRRIIQEDEQTVNVKDAAAVRRRGEAKTEFQSEWIQNKAAADELGRWVVENWAGGVDSIELTVFGNFLIELGDLVTINYPLKGMDPDTHKYFVVSIGTDYNNSGPTTTLSLRRAKV